MTGLVGFSNSVAFLVAIDRYGNGVPGLRSPVSDAEALAKVLREAHGFETKVLANEQATLEGLRGLLTDLAARVGAGDRMIFYFAGHGIALSSEDGPKGFLLPQDAQQNSSDNYFAMDELNRSLEALSCRHMLAILDCCFAGALRWSSYRNFAAPIVSLHRERYEWFVHDAAWQAIASAAHDQEALDVAAAQPLGKREDAKEQAHSPFASALIRGLEGAADLAPKGRSPDGVITATELYSYLQNELLPKSEGDFLQRPLFWPMKKHDKGEFVFLTPGRELSLPPAPPLDADANPWRGLQPYETRHADLFHGRDAVSKRLIERVLSERFIVVTGPSGVGKSSLVRAGLLSGLMGKPLEPIVVRPGPEPFASLSRGLNDATPGGDVSPNALKTDLSALAAWVKERSGPKETLLVIDQAEELITMNHDDDAARTFLTLIDRALAEGGERLRTVLTLRSEFEPQFAQGPLKERWAQARFLVPPMTQDELRRVIEEPAGAKVMRFEPADIVDRLVNDVVQMPGALPLLSFALSQMYLNYLNRRGNDRALSDADYKALEGGVAGALRVRANQVVDGVDEAHRLTARRVLERLVSVETGEYARRRVPRREFEVDDPAEQARVDDVLRRLDEARLVVTDVVDDHPYLEFAHDALILGWDRLTTWVREDIALIAELRRLTPDAEAWQGAAMRRGGWLWSDPERLAAVRRLRAEPSPGLNRCETRFATASIRRATRNKVVRWSAVATLVGLLLAAGKELLQSQLRLGDNVTALTKTSLELFDADRRFDALLMSLRAERLEDQRLLPVAWLPVRPVSEIKRVQALQEAVLWLQERNRLKGHAAAVNTVSFSPDGGWLASGSAKGQVWLWDVSKGRLERELKRSDGAEVHAVRFSPHGDRLASAGTDGVIHIWNLTTGASSLLEDKAIAGASGDIVFSDRMSFSADGKRLAIVAGSRLDIWNVETRKSENEYAEDNGTGVDFSPVADEVAVAHWRGKVTVRDLNTGTSTELVDKDDKNKPWGIIDSVSFSPDGKMLAFAGEDGMVHVVDPTNGHTISSLKGHSKSVRFSPDGRTLASAGPDGVVRLWDTSTWLPVDTLSTMLSGYIGYINSISFSPDGMLASAGNDGTVRLWDLRRGETNVRLTGHSAEVFDVDFSPVDENRLASVAWDGKAILWDVEKEKATRVSRTIGTTLGYSQIKSVRFSPDGSTVALGGFGSYLELYDAAKGTIQRQGEFSYLLQGIGYSPNGRWLAAGSWPYESPPTPGMVRVYDLNRSKDEPSCRVKHTAGVQDIAFSPNSELLASASQGGNINLVQLSNCKQDTVQSFGEASGLSFSPDGKQLVALNNTPPTVMRWDVDQPRSPHSDSKLEDDSSDQGQFQVYAASFSPKGDMLAAAASDGTIKLWDVETRKLLKILKVGRNGIRSLRFSRTGVWLASTSGNDVVVWDVSKASKPDLHELRARGCELLHNYLANNGQAGLCEGVGASVKQAPISAPPQQSPEASRSSPRSFTRSTQP